jgi:hypothetical protein
METPESWFHRRATFYVEAQILFHLNQAGVFDRLNSEGALTAAAIAESLRLDARVTETLLDYIFEVDDLLAREHGRYSLSEFGKKVIDRFSEQRSINMFDVRVGAYGPVWQNIGRMLSGDGLYGRDFHRAGKFAENGVFKLAMNFWKSLVRQVEEVEAGSVVEVGLTTVLLERLGENYPDLRLYGLDKNKQIIENNAVRASAKNLNNISWLNSDYFDLGGWCEAVDAKRKGLIYSLHFHELIAQSENKFIEALRELRTVLPNWTVVAFEQPRLPHDEKAGIPETLWLYSQSNILIHHLIGNGKILSEDAWKDLGYQAGCRNVKDRACDYLGYRAFVFEL